MVMSTMTAVIISIMGITIMDQGVWRTAIVWTSVILFMVIAQLPVIMAIRAHTAEKHAWLDFGVPVVPVDVIVIRPAISDQVSVQRYVYQVNMATHAKRIVLMVRGDMIVYWIATVQCHALQQPEFAPPRFAVKVFLAGCAKSGNVMNHTGVGTVIFHVIVMVLVIPWMAYVLGSVKLANMAIHVKRIVMTIIGVLIVLTNVVVAIHHNVIWYLVHVNVIWVTGEKAAIHHVVHVNMAATS